MPFFFARGSGRIRVLPRAPGIPLFRRKAQGQLRPAEGPPHLKYRKALPNYSGINAINLAAP